MKKLGLPELFRTARMISESGLKASITGIMEAYTPKDQESTTDAQIRVGKQMFEAILDNLGNPVVEKWLYDMLAGVTGNKVDEVKALGLDEILDIFLEIKEENNLADFFDKVKRLIAK